MSFSEQREQLLAEPSALLSNFAQLLDIDEAEDSQLESVLREASDLTRQRFGNTMRLFAPLYLSNECVNNCSYCGFSRDNPILRTTLSVEQVSAEAQHLLEQGFRSILLVAGEHPKFVSDGYMEECLEALRDKVPSLALEVGPMETAEYQRMVEAGAESLVVYQETYDEIIYREMHTAGPKKDYNWRLDCPERAYRGGFRRIGVGALMGLADWKTEALGLAAHLEYLYKHCWKSSFTLSLPRLRPAAGGFAPRTKFSDRNLVHLLSALRLSFPDLGLVLSTREPAALRDALLPLCITQMSAGSHTEPGGYTGAGSDDLHYTQRGKRLEISELSNLDKKDSAETGSCATGQFDIADHRSPSDIAALLDEKGFEAVWKDWDPSFLKNNNQLAAL